MSGTAPTNVANGVHTPFLLLPLGEATDGGAAGVPPPPTANSLLLAHPGPAGAANNLAASRQNQQRIANAAVAGVDGIIYIDEVDAESMRCPQNRDNIEALDGINNAMLQATHMISQTRPVAAAAAAAAVAPLPNAAARPLLPGGDGDVIASLYARLVSARAASRTDAVDRYERMIDRLERREEEELESRLLKHN